MTQAETSRGPGKPRIYDEDQVLERVRSVDDLVRVREALEANGEGLTARGVFQWLLAKHLGDPTGGGFSRMSETTYRKALARLPELPLPPASKHRRSAPRSQRGSARRVLVSVGAGAGVLAMLPESASELVRFELSPGPPIMPQRLREPAELELAA